ncbi:MAG TPA: DUF423 domain-containing protein [Flavobacterium sp.]|jgi:uncharacterized membrane protein YgdD (TMEM256/DUF423 family)
MDRKILAAGAFFGMTAVILGAFGAHALKEVLSPQQIVTFETGVKYQFYHALLLLFIGSGAYISEKKRQVVFWLVVLGTIMFSGSIYLLATDSLNDVNFRQFGFITPIGGTLLIVAWFLLFIDFLRKKS